MNNPWFMLVWPIPALLVVLTAAILVYITKPDKYRDPSVGVLPTKYLRFKAILINMLPEMTMATVVVILVSLSGYA